MTEQEAVRPAPDKAWLYEALARDNEQGRKDAIRTNITAVAIAIIGTGLVTGAILLLARRTS